MPELRQQVHADSSGELRALEQLAKEQSSDKRRELMSRLANILTIEVDAYPDEVVIQLGETLITLLDHLDEPSRCELSERVAPHERTPHVLAKKLAQDISVNVAEPVLRHSPVLTDDDLVEIASEQSEGHQLAMSRRTNLSVQVTDAIIEHGTNPVFEAVAVNSGAEISETGFVRLSGHAPSNAELAAALSRRIDLPEAVTEKVIAGLPLEYRLQLEGLWKTDASSGEALFDEVAHQFGQARLKSKRGLLEARVAEKDITNGTRSLDRVIIDFAGSNRPAETAYVIAAMAKFPESFVRTALFRQDGTAIALICRSINLKDGAFEEITRMRGSQLSLDASDGHKLLQAFRSLDVVSARRTVRFAAARHAAEDPNWDRRSGHDVRSEEERRDVGERRSGQGRRSAERA